MKSMAVAAMMVQLMASGGAGAHGERTAERRDAAADDLGKNLSALKSELSSVSEQFKAARERRRMEAEQKKRQEEEWKLGPTTPAASTAGRAAAPSRGAGASSH
ncbi:hypothetical protein [Pyxidicoccus trucidator]|uniref:hypothetical protein n=1 Tax=Pyxidicoccus trucidator TaxID=2709662 RepID=UPI001F071B34|nr:hypothetical protein [Pyxidicoccus trucidator]